MKIICSWCKKLLGDKEPFDDPSESHARCPECLEKQRKEEALKKDQKLTPPKKSRVVKVQEGIEGRLSIAGKESPKLAFLQIDFSGRKFTCSQDKKAEFEKYIQGLPGDQVSVTWLHSGEYHMDLPQSKRGKKKGNKVDPPLTKGKDVTYNCTILVSKTQAYAIYQSSIQKTNEVVELFAEAAYNMLCRQNAEKPNVQVDT